MHKQYVTKNIQPQDNDLEILKKYFPHCFDKNSNFDFEKFKNFLTEKEINFSKESYGLDWLGKSYARLLACDPATTLLKADETHNNKPENINSQNLLIKGDNLEVLKHLANAYYEKIKMIYIDPPYNTGSDGFVYNDDRKYTVKELQDLLGIDEEKAKRILNFTTSKSNSHSAWLTFMYPRLYIAKQLLREDGVIFVSIDDNEVAQLRLLMDEVFGEENFVDSIVRKTKSYDRDKSAKEFQKIYDTVLVFSKKRELFKIKQIITGVKQFPLIDEFGSYKLNPLQNKGPNGYRDKRPKTYYPIYISEDGNISIEKNNENDKEIFPDKIGGKDGTWSWSKEKLIKEKRRIVIQDNYLFIKIYEDKNKDNNKYVSEQNVQLNYLNSNGSTRLTLLGMQDLFSNPKPVELIKWCINLSTNLNDLILDFFAGSGTTGDAVMQLNAEDGGNRKFILVQLPEPIDPKKNKTAYDFVKNELKAEPTIFEICKERLIRAANKIKTETIDKKIAEKEKEINELTSQLDLENSKEKIKEIQAEIEALKNQDLGFKVFETIPIWEDYNFEEPEFNPSQTLFDVGKLTEDDIKALLLTWKTYDGIPLTQDLENIDLCGYGSFYGNGKLYLMHKGFTTDNLKALLEKIDTDKHFEPKTIIAFGYHFESARLRELAENVKHYANKKHIDIEFITRY